MPNIKIFIASPGDVGEERDIISKAVIPELRRIFGDEQIFGRENTINLEAIRWETHTWPDIGEDAQDVINRQIGDFDVLVGIMWKRFGTPTNRADSGTGEEFERAFQYHKAYNRPKIMFYFRKSEFYTTDPEEWSQFNKVLTFRQKLITLGVRFNEYDSPLEFERFVREHLIRQIFRLYNLEPKTDTTESLLESREEPVQEKRAKVKIFLSYAHEDKPTILDINSALKAAGFDPWLDTDKLLPGQDWMEVIHHEIASANVVLFFLSNKSVSKEGYLNKELRLALDQAAELPEDQIYLVPVRIEDVEPPKAFQKLQWLDYFNNGGKEKLLKLLDHVAESINKDDKKINKQEGG